MFFKKKATGTEELSAPMKGEYIEQTQIPDEIFAEGMLGTGCGIRPEEGFVYAPADGRIVSVAETRHAIGIETENKAELLIHVGMDTVELNGQGFEVFVKEGDKVVKGQKLLSCDLAYVELKGFPTVTAFMVTNADQFEKISIETGRNFTVSEKIGEITK